MESVEREEVVTDQYHLPCVWTPHQSGFSTRSATYVTKAHYGAYCDVTFMGCDDDDDM